jgi:parvulin-like peptidyl-prolyl isomerase
MLAPQTRPRRPTPSPHPSANADRRGMLLLALGAALGVVLAAAGLLRGGPAAGGALPAGAAARVNGQLIGLGEYEQAVNALAQDRKSGVDDAQRKFVLDRLIDQELLLQRGLELGLARSDPRARNLINSAMIAAAVADADAVQAFYDSERALFTDSGRVQARQIWFRAATPAEAETAYGRALQAKERLQAGEDFAAVKAALGDAEIAPLPEAPLPASKLGEYLGPTALRVVLELPVGTISDPVRSHTGYHILQAMVRLPGEAPPFAEIKPAVLAEFRRRAADQALKDYIEDLRRRAAITIAPELQ